MRTASVCESYTAASSEEPRRGCQDSAGGLLPENYTLDWATSRSLRGLWQGVTTPKCTERTRGWGALCFLPPPSIVVPGQQSQGQLAQKTLFSRQDDSRRRKWDARSREMMCPQAKRDVGGPTWPLNSSCSESTSAAEGPRNLLAAGPRSTICKTKRLLAKNKQRWLFSIKKSIWDRKRKTETPWRERGPITDGIKNRNVFLLLAEICHHTAGFIQADETTTASSCHLNITDTVIIKSRAQPWAGYGPPRICVSTSRKHLLPAEQKYSVFPAVSTCVRLLLSLEIQLLIGIDCTFSAVARPSSRFNC